MSAPSLDARFQPQQWIRDNAEDSGPGETFDAAEAVLSLSAEQVRYIDAQVSRPSGRDLDEIAYAAGLVGKDAHDGPFVVSIDEDDWKAFLEECGLSDVASLTDARISDAKASLTSVSPGR
jgi:hypothetical protein